MLPIKDFRSPFMVNNNNYKKQKQSTVVCSSDVAPKEKDISNYKELEITYINK